MRIVLVPTLIVSILMTAPAFAQGPVQARPSVPRLLPTAVQTPAAAREPSLRFPRTVPAGGTGMTPWQPARRPVGEHDDLVTGIVTAVVATVVLLLAG